MRALLGSMTNTTDASHSLWVPASGRSVRIVSPFGPTVSWTGETPRKAEIWIDDILPLTLPELPVGASRQLARTLGIIQINVKKAGRKVNLSPVLGELTLRFPHSLQEEKADNEKQSDGE